MFSTPKKGRKTPVKFPNFAGLQATIAVCPEKK